MASNKRTAFCKAEESTKKNKIGKTDILSRACDQLSEKNQVSVDEDFSNFVVENCIMQLEENIQSYEVSARRKVLSFTIDGVFYVRLLKIENGLERASIELDRAQLGELLQQMTTLEVLLIQVLDCGKRISVRYHLGNNCYVGIQHEFPVIDIRKFFIDMTAQLKPTRRGVTFTLDEFKALRLCFDKIIDGTTYF
jgi:hypothetical protein